MNNRSLFLKFLLLLGLISFYQCGKDKIIDNEQIIECDQISIAVEVFNKLSSQADYIVSYAEFPEFIEFSFKLHQIIRIQKECVESIQANDEKFRIKLKLVNTNVLDLDYQNTISISYIHNPLGVTPLSGLLKLNTDIAGKLSMTVKSKSPEQAKFYHEFDDESNKKSLAILGMYYNMNNEIYLDFIDENEHVFKDTISVTIGERPNFLPPVIVDVHDEFSVEPGMNFISSRVSEPSAPYFVDNYGEYRFVFDFSGHPELGNLNFDVGMERLKNGNFYFGKYLSNLMYEIDILGNIIHQWNLGDFEFHHNVQEKEDGNLLATVSRYDAHISNRRSIEDWIVEVDRTSGAIVHSWNLKECLDQTRRLYGWWEWSDLVDWAHVNAVIHDPRDNTIIVSCRTQCLVKLDYNNKVKWILDCHRDWKKNIRGEDLNDFLLTPVDASGAPITDNDVLLGNESHPDFEWPWYQHAPLLNDKGHLMVFDNGENRNFSLNDLYSRAVEYQIDEVNMTVKQIWQYGKERGIEAYSRIVSDVDVLPETGNIYFCPGSRVNNGSGNFGAKIIEVNYETKEVVFEMRINAPNIVFHRAERMNLYPDNY